MALPPLIRPTVVAQPTLETANWFLRLRWVAVAGQLLTMGMVAWGFGIELPVWKLLMLIGTTAATNGCYWLWLSRIHYRGLQPTDRLPTDFVISGLMFVDLFVLTGMLYISAGIANPFALFYFVNVAVAAAIISPAWAWALWVTTVGAVAILLVRSLPLPALAPSLYAATPGLGDTWTIPKLGFLVAFATCSGVIIYFITILTGELRQREQALKEAEDARLRNRQLEGLATLAAGAAHELATPLTTIAVVAKELYRALEKQDAPEATRQDVNLIRSELDQCRLILDRMTSAAGEAAGEKLQEIGLAGFIEETLVGLRQSERVRQEINDAEDSRSLLPVQATAQAVRNLLQNAIDASEHGKPVTMAAISTQERWTFRISDEGYGMEPEVLKRIGEPFFTTKEPGRGMGLGLYLTENVVRRLGGELQFESQPGIGTTATLILPTQR